MSSEPGVEINLKVGNDAPGISMGTVNERPFTIPKTIAEISAEPKPVGTPENPVVISPVTSLADGVDKTNNGNQLIKEPKSTFDQQKDAATEREAKMKADLDAKAKSEASSAVSSVAAEPVPTTGTPENPAIPIAPVEAPPAKTPDEVPLDPVITTVKEIPQTKAKVSKTEAETPEQHIARIEKEIADKIDQKTEEKRRSGKGKIMGGEKLAIAQEVYMRELKGYSIEEMPGFRGEFGRFFAFLSGREKVKVVDNNAKDKDGKPLVKKIVKRNWMLHDPSQELVDTLKSEFENEARKVKEEVVPQQVSEIAQKPASPEVITEETTVAEEASSEDLRDSARQYDDYLVALKYTPERGGDGLMRLRSNEKGDNEKGDNEKGEYAIDKETGKPFEFEKFSEANKFLKKKLEQKNAPQNLTEMMEDKTPAEKTKEEVLV
jgi:hypothetical protein